MGQLFTNLNIHFVAFEWGKQKKKNPQRNICLDVWFFYFLKNLKYFSQNVS